MIIFLHIPKTAGMTLMWMLEDHVDPRHSLRIYYRADHDQLAAMPPQQRQAVQLVCGHVRYGFDRYFPGQDVQYITMLRHPLKRIVSHYHHMMRQATEPYISTPFADWIDMIAHDRLDRERFSTLMDNRQVRDLANVPLRQPVTTDHVAQAIHNLENGILAYGLTERFDASVALMQKALGWENAAYITRNTAKKQNTDQVPRPVVTPAVREILTEYDAMDHQLYDYAAAHFDEQLQRFGVTQSEIESVKDMSAFLRLRLLLSRVRRKLL